jgi:hypothetical protein
MIKIKVDHDIIRDVSYTFKLEFFKFNSVTNCTGKYCLGTLVRPTHKDYAINQTESGLALMVFIDKVVLKENAVLDIDSSSGRECKFIYQKYKDFDDFGITIDMPRALVLNQCSESVCRSLWNDLIRMGFRPSLDMFLKIFP